MQDSFGIPESAGSIAIELVEHGMEALFNLVLVGVGDESLDERVEPEDHLLLLGLGFGVWGLGFRV
jgi:hypothetical protein